MKFSLFVHMERFDPAKPHRELFHELVELVEIAEAGGFEMIWIGEHLGMEFTIAPNPFDFMAYLAARTQRIRLGVGTVIAPFWHPLRLAGEAALVDIMSGGRLELGLARGAYQFEFDRMLGGMKATEGGKHLRELIPVLQRLFVGDCAHQGECWSFPTATAMPKPLQTPYPPMWIAARDPDSHNFAVANGCNVMVTPLWHPDEEVVSLRDRFNAALANNPGVPRPRLMLLRHTHVHERTGDWETPARALSRYYSYFEEWFRNQRPISNGFIEPLSEAEIAAKAHFAPQLMRDNLVIGQPDTVITRLKYYERLGYDQYSYWIDNGLPHAAKKRSLELFVDEVMPAFA
ncbi:MAG TPA: LLM class flavin-dependent oxidoreductase [Candidatus Competibacteraceae bacterium]|nr:LLM class flavin-dependent oxidoreductase [Candidatus Competibacteraceae bacterium]